MTSDFSIPTICTSGCKTVVPEEKAARLKMVLCVALDTFPKVKPTNQNACRPDLPGCMRENRETGRPVRSNKIAAARDTSFIHHMSGFGLDDN